IATKSNGKFTCLHEGTAIHGIHVQSHRVSACSRITKQLRIDLRERRLDYHYCEYQNASMFHDCFLRSMNSSLLEIVTGKLRRLSPAGPLVTSPRLSNSLPCAGH